MITTADGTAWYLKDSTLRTVDAARRGAVQFWVRSEPTSQSAWRWSVRVYLDCATKQYVPSIVAASDVTGKLLQFTTKGWAPQNWVNQDPTGLIATVSKRVCPSS